MKINAITVQERHRKDIGDIAALARSIEDVGLLHPVVVTPDNTLIAGERRLEALKLLGREEVPVTVVHLDNIVNGEFAENMARKAFTPTEEVAIYRTLQPEESAAAKKRMSDGGKVGKVSTPSGKTRDKVGAYITKSGRTLEKQVAIVEAAEAEPERFGKLVADMDRTGRVDGPYKRLKVMRQAEAIRREPPPLPDKGPYRVIVADPPWPYELRKQDPSHRATHPYPQMSIEKICELDVGEIAHDDCLLWLWTTNHHMREAFTVLDAWEFKHKTILTWVREAKGADGKPTKRLNLMAEKVAELAAQGEPWAVKEAWDRLEGKAPQAIEHSGQLDTAPLGGDAMATLLARIDAISGRLPDKDPTGPKRENPSEPD